MRRGRGPTSRLARALAVLGLVLALCGIPGRAAAFGGFYVDGAGTARTSETARVVLLRAGLRTVASIQSDYKGPPEDFALVVPVPVVLERDSVRTLPAGVLDRVDSLTAPRLVEYWEQDPCSGALEDRADEKEGGGARARGEGEHGGRPPPVKVEAEYSVDEYDVVVLSAGDSAALESWLVSSGYKIPAGAEAYLRPYVEAGSKFFVAKVDAKRVRFKLGRALLSPLRFFYDSPTFTLPTRLGLINASGVQDLVVYVLGSERYEAANYENLTIPTNLTVRGDVRAAFPAFYGALFDRTVKGHARAVVTEYAGATSCEPCPAGSEPLGKDDMELLGVEVLPERPVKPFVVTRLHARYGKDSAGEDIAFRAAPPIAGGQETRSGQLGEGAQPSKVDAFQARYVIRHGWEGAITCSAPEYGVWGGPPYGYRWRPPPKATAGGRRDADLDALIVPANQAAALGRGAAAEPFGARALRWAIGLRARPSDDAWRSLGAAALLFAVTVIVAWRARSGKLVAATLYVVLVPLGMAIGTLGGATFDVSRVSRVSAAALVNWLAFGALLVGAAVVSALRVRPSSRAEGRRVVVVVAALLPALVGLLDGYLALRGSLAFIGQDDADYDQAARIAAEITADTYEAIVVGCLRSALLLLPAAYFVRPAREGRPKPTWEAFVTGAVIFALALVARIIVRAHFAPIDALLLAAFIGAAYIVHDAFARRGGRRTLLVVVSAVGVVALLGIAAHLRSVAVMLATFASNATEDSLRSFVLKFGIHEERARLLLGIIDVLLLAAFAVLRARSALARLDAGNVFATLLLLLALAGAALAPRWTGRAQALASFGADAARFTGAPLVPPPPFGATGSPDLAGPAFILDRRLGLKVSPRAGAATESYGPTTAESVAKAQADTAQPPLLVAPADLTTRSMIRALQPALEDEIVDYRLLREPPPYDPSLGPYGPLLTADLEATPIEVAPVFAVSDDQPSEWAQPCTGFLLDGDVLHLVPLVRDGDAWVLGGVKLDGDLGLDGRGASEARGSILMAKTSGLAVIAVAPEATIDVVNRAAALVFGLGAQRLHEAPLFTRIVISPGRASIERALRLLREAPPQAE